MRPSKLSRAQLKMSNAQLSKCAAARVRWKVTTTGRFQLPPDNATQQRTFMRKVNQCIGKYDRQKSDWRSRKGVRSNCDIRTPNRKKKFGFPQGRLKNL